MLEVLEIGSGKSPYKAGYYEKVTHLDIAKLEHVEVVHDLQKFPYPFRDGRFDVVIANHVLEHLDDVVRTLEELHRILKPSGTLKIRVPFFADPSNFHPAHRHSFTHTSFDEFEDRHPCSYYSKVRFEIKICKYVFRKKLTGILGLFFNRFKGFYLINFPYLFPANEIYFELEAVKG